MPVFKNIAAYKFAPLSDLGPLRGRLLAACRLHALRGTILVSPEGKRPDALQWLERFGNPYTQSIADTAGLVGIDYGVYGVPETFVIDKSGVIRHKLIGPITPESLRDEILPLVKKLNG